MIKIPFSKLITIVNGYSLYHKELLINTISSNSKNCSNALFIAFKGERFDGHNYLVDAKKNGCIAYCISQEITSLLPTIYVKDTMQAYQKIAQYHINCFNNSNVAITGSAGKSSICQILGQSLNFQQKSLLTIQNTNNHIGLAQNILRLTSQESHAILELGTNHRDEIKNLCKIYKAKIAIISNIGTSHLGNFEDFNDLVEEKTSLLTNLKECKIAIIPEEQKALFKAKISHLTCYTFGFEKHADMSLEIIKQDLKTSTIKLNFKKQSYQFTTKIIGKKQLLNIASSALAYILLGYNLNDFIKTCNKISLLKMRLEIQETKDFIFINDAYNASKESFIASFEFLQAAIKNQRVFLILADVKELGKHSKEIHTTIAKKASILPSNWQILTIGKYMNEAFNNSVKFTEQEEIITYLKSNLKHNDVIFFKGSRSMHLEHIMENLICYTI